MLTMNGYSGTPLALKIGVKRDHVVFLDGAPAGFALDRDSPVDARVVTRLPKSCDITLTFHRDRATFERRLPTLIERTVTDGMIWVCWPKKASKVPTDLDENLIRAFGLASGLVDVKVAAIDDVWSGLKFVRRLADR